MKGRVLIVAGSDSGGGAGIQGDVKTVSALNGFATTAITAITVQNTQGVESVFPVPPTVIASQMRVVLDDIGADAIKTGMLHDAEVINAVVMLLEEKAKGIPLVVDPVMVSKSGASLLADRAVTALKKNLLPLATLITPNIPEAEALLGTRIKSVEDMRNAAKGLQRLGAKAVLMKGGHMEGATITDILWDGAAFTEWTSPRMETRHTHGTGCTLASAIATYLAQGQDMKTSVAKARDYVQGALAAAPGFGKGAGPLNHSWMLDEADQ